MPIPKPSLAAPAADTSAGQTQSFSEAKTLAVQPDDSGRICCPNVRENGESCGKFIGHFAESTPRWFCPRCKVELVASPAASMEAALQTGSLYIHVRSASKRELLQIYLLTDARAQDDRSRVLALIDSLPD